MAVLALTMYSRPDCPLCEKMKEAVREAARGLPHELFEIDISQDPELEARYGLDIPVLVVNQRAAFRHRVVAAELRDHLRHVLRTGG